MPFGYKILTMELHDRVDFGISQEGGDGRNFIMWSDSLLSFAVFMPACAPHTHRDARAAAAYSLPVHDLGWASSTLTPLVVLCQIAVVGVFLIRVVS